MAAAVGPEAAAEGWRRLLRAVTRLQACVRGFLVRRRLRAVRAAYERLVREIEGDSSCLEWRGRILPRPVFVPEKPTPGECPCPRETAPRDEAGAGKPQEELDTCAAERDWGCSSVGAPAGVDKPSWAAGGDAASPPNADRHPEKGGSALAEGIPPEDMEELPGTQAALQSYRNHLLMEMLWLQQAIESRKKYLMLKRRLEAPDA
ncbi:IQ domain-containing protein C [Colius striatus]|uniref:IQ domain-containing protein C n=1 Tax=Colius striatus TaxID=57412 RepID=UPI002B1E42C2|nr:IQ domain-containing protein C [Colius striatus]